MGFWFGNSSLSKLCRKNSIRNVVNRYKMSFMAYFPIGSHLWLVEALGAVWCLSQMQKCIFYGFLG